MPEVPNPHDVFAKKTFGKVALAAEFFRYYLPAELTQELDTTRVTLAKGSFVDKRLREHFSDLLFRVALRCGGAAFVYLLLEHKSAPDPWVARQLLRYLALIWARWSASGKLPLIIPVVFYHGAPRWDAPTQFSALFDVPEALAAVARLYLPDFRYYLCDLSAYNDAELMGGPELRAKLLLLKHIFAADFLARLPEALQMLLAHLPLEEVNEEVEAALRYAQHTGRADEQEMLAALEEAARQHRGGEMETIVDKWRNEGKVIGLVEGEQRASLSMALRLVQRKFGKVRQSLATQISVLPVPQLQELGVALLDFQTPHDLAAWLKEHAPQTRTRRRKQ